MNFNCPNCGQGLETDAKSAGKPVQCPDCGHSFPIPKAGTNGPRTQRPMRGGGPVLGQFAPPKKDGGGFRKALLLLLILAAGGFGFAMYHFHESPQQVWNRLTTAFKKFTSAAPAPTPSPAPVPTPTATPVPSATPEATPSATPAPTPVDPLAWLREHKEYWPKEITLLQEAEFPVVFNGKVAGSAKLPAGHKVGIASIEPEFVTVNYQGGIQKVAIAATDLREQAEAAVRTTLGDAEAAAAKTVLAVTPAPSATPAASPQGSPEADTETEGLATDDSAAKSGAFVHPGLLHDEADFKRMRTHKGRDPWKGGWERLTANRHSSLDYTPHPAERVVRGHDRLHTEPENYGALYNDIAASYACALRWRISGERRYAEKAVEILNAWSATLKELGGSTDVCLAGGIYGYEFANAAEIMRTYKGWKPEDFARFQKMMLDVFYPINKAFLERHNGTKIDHYWANWDLCNMASMMAIGVLCDKRSIYNDAVHYFKHGKGNGAIRNLVNYIHPDGLGQWQEAGRDQGHTVMGIGIAGAICEMAWKQGDDLYGYDDNRFLKGCEYVAKYNLGEDVPFHKYTNSDVTHEVVADGSRGNLRPVWELVYNHYVKRKGLPAPYTTQMAEKVRPEGGGGDYGPNSGGYDQLGYGTLTASLSLEDVKAANPKATPSFFGTPAGGAGTKDETDDKDQ